MSFRIQFHIGQHKFEEQDADYKKDVIDNVCNKKNQYDSIQVYEESNGLFNCVLMIENGQVQWGEYSLQKQAEIQIREIDEYGDFASEYGFNSVTLDQIEQYYDDHLDEIMDSLWPELPEWEEVYDILVRQNNPDLLNTEASQQLM